MNRREIFKISGLAATGTLLPGGVAALSNAPFAKKRVLRIAHLTDVHLHDNPEDYGNAPEGLEKCLHHVQNLKDPVDLIFNGGDSINDALNTSYAKVKAQWKLWHSVMNQENSLQVVDCIGNHDVWGAGSKNDPLYGKKWAMEEMELESRYRSFDKNGWHFIVLDSTYSEGGDWYKAKLDEEQFEWLKQDLDAVDEDVPIFVFSHIPIMCAAAYLDGNNEKSGNWRVPGAWMHIDARKIIELFHLHKNIQICISGHIHLLDKVVYNDVTYYCNGAVSGNWWGGNYQQTPPGYALINLYSDGSFDRDYVSY